MKRTRLVAQRKNMKNTSKNVDTTDQKVDTTSDQSTVVKTVQMTEQFDQIHTLPVLKRKLEEKYFYQICYHCGVNRCRKFIYSIFPQKIEGSVYRSSNRILYIHGKFEFNEKLYNYQICKQCELLNEISGNFNQLIPDHEGRLSPKSRQDNHTILQKIYNTTSDYLLKVRMTGGFGQNTDYETIVLETQKSLCIDLKCIETPEFRFDSERPMSPMTPPPKTSNAPLPDETTMEAPTVLPVVMPLEFSY